MFKINNKDTKTTFVFGVFIANFINPFCRVPIVNFKQVIVCWGNE